MKENSIQSEVAHDAFLPRNTRRSLPIALLRAREAVMENFRPLLSSHDLTEQQWRVVRVLAEQGVTDATEIAEKAFILAPSLTRIVRTLEERGLLTRKRDAQDGRRQLLEITQAGIAIINKVTPESRLIYQRLEQKYGISKIELLLDMLDELATINQE